jgi:cobalt/nickel transport protein
MIPLEAAMRRIWPAILALLIGATPSFAHYNMLLPDKAWAQKDEKVTFTYQFGHPFEHELFDAPKPAGLMVHLPSGKLETLDVDKTLTKVEVPGADGKKVAAWRFDYTPAERGDHVFLMKTARIKHEEGKFLEDTVKVVLHVQTQNGWDWNSFKMDFDKGADIVPYTRPYGLLAGMVFRGRVICFPRDEGGVNGPGNLRIEVEKYNVKPNRYPSNRDLPPDELITFQTKTDGTGLFVTTLPEPGWWAVTAIRRSQGEADVSRRATLWVHVDEKK